MAVNAPASVPTIRARIAAVALVGLAAAVSVSSAAAADSQAGQQKEPRTERPGCVTDDLAREVCLEAPAERIIALSPSLTELAYAAGAGEALVGAVSFSDYPPEAEALPRVGSYNRLDIEAILALEPDLVLAWNGGSPQTQLDQLSALGLPVYYSDAQDFAAIAYTIERLGQLSGQQSQANSEAQRVRDGVATLEQRYKDAAPVSVFYQIWEKPLMTINGEHWISRSLTLCGGVNQFADADALVPRPSIENVLAGDPEAIITGGLGEPESEWLDSWQRFTQLSAVQHDNLLVIDPDLVHRATPRLLEGTRQLCELLDDVRERR